MHVQRLGVHLRATPFKMSCILGLPAQLHARPHSSPRSEHNIRNVNAGSVAVLTAGSIHGPLGRPIVGVYSTAGWTVPPTTR